MPDQIVNAADIFADAQPISLPTLSLPAQVSRRSATTNIYKASVGWNEISALFPESGDGALGIAGVVGGVVELVRHCAAIGAAPKVITGAHVYGTPTLGGWTIYITALGVSDVLMLTGDATLSDGSRTYARSNTGMALNVFMTETKAVDVPRFWTRHVQTVETA